MPSFSTALSALNANSTAIDVVGNNLANLNTPGFKAVGVNFSDMVSQSLGTGTEVGFGVNTPQTIREFKQGAIQPGSGALTAAIEGQGFFVLQNDSGTMYTRVGSFKLTGTGQLVSTGSQQPVMGWNAVNGTVNTNGAAVPIQVPTAPIPPKATTAMTIDMNLDIKAEVGATASAPVTVTDSLGNTHVVTVTFTKATDTTWDYEATLPTGDGTATGIGTLTFNSDGVLTAPATADIGLTGLPNGANDMTIAWNFLNANGTPRFTQYNGASTPSAIYQDGYPSAAMSGIEIQDGGRVVASYSNGQQQVVAVLGIANVTNPTSLKSIGNNAFQATIDSAIAPPAPGGIGGRGRVIGQSIEASTVDIAKEFTNLIIYQRGYQAASRVITTADEISQETINLKR